MSENSNKIRLILGDSLEVLKRATPNSIDSIVCDPPYGISFMSSKWDYDVPSVEIWKECYRVLKPGGYLLSFAGTRTQHRMAVNIEDAGFEIRDMIAWVYGSGFPKSLNIGKAVDKRGGTTSDESKEFAEYIKNRRIEQNITLTKADEVVCGGTTNYSWFEGRPAGQRLPRKSDYLKMKELLQLDDRYDGFMEETEREFLGKYETDMGGLGGERLGEKGGNITKGNSEWEGWGTALKPALEPITVARKPLSEKTVAENVLKWGTGGINIDGSRVGMEVITTNGKGKQDGSTPIVPQHPDFIGETHTGRFPANLIHDGSDEVVSLFPDTKSGNLNAGHKRGNGTGNSFTGGGGIIEGNYGGDSGSAARFFYCAKASKADRDEGLESYQDKVVHSALNTKNGAGERFDGATSAIRKNHHPTVKPTKLMQYLVKLVTPKGGVVLDPFMGSGSTGKACKLEGFDFIGIEREPEYVEIAKARIGL